MDHGRRDRGRGGRRGYGGRGEGRPRSGGGRQGWETQESGTQANELSLRGTQITAIAQQYTEGQLVRRPDQGGRAGKQIQVYANFFQMRYGIEKAYHYDLDIKQGGQAALQGEGDEPMTGQQLLPMTLCRSIINECAAQNNWQGGWIHDGKKNLYTTTAMFARERRIYTVDMSGGSGRERLFDVGVKLASEVSLHDLRRYIEQENVSVPRDAIQTIEVCLRFSASNNPACHLAGRSIYFDDPDTSFTLSGGAELWMGYHQGVKVCQSGLMLNVDTTCTAFRQKRSILQLLEDAIGMPIGELRGFDQGVHNAMNKAVSNVLVRTTHRSDSKKHRCKGLTNSSAINTTFTLKDESTLSVAQYWQEAYGGLRYPHLPCLNVSKGRKVMYLPPEVCEVVPGQRLQNLNEDQTRGTIRYTATNPADRRQNIMGVLGKANISGDRSAQTFGVQIRPEMTQVPARVLPSPHLQYQQPESLDTGDRGAWNLESVKFYKPATLNCWAIVSCVPERVSLRPGEQGLPVFIESLVEMMERMGMTVANGRPPLVHKYRQTMSEALQEAMDKAEQTYERPAELLFVLLERKESGPYQEVKRTAEGPLGITTQCCVARNAGIGSQPRGRMQYLANIAMKINQKLGGVNTQVTGTISRMFPVLGGGLNKPFIVLGVDVTHPTSFDQNDPSVGAIVASMDPHLGQFAARVLSLGHREEKLPMRDAIRDLFRQFYQRNRVKPEAVFLYRDGVSEGQFQEVFEYEYNEIREACRMLEEEYRPPITLVLVQKRHHTRLFPLRPQDGDNKGNVVPGTCVDTSITSRYDFDFYLNSHSGIQGTNRPAHYYVLVDENGFGSDGQFLMSHQRTMHILRLCMADTLSAPVQTPHQRVRIMELHRFSTQS